MFRRNFTITMIDWNNATVITHYFYQKNRKEIKKLVKEYADGFQGCRLYRKGMVVWG